MDMLQDDNLVWMDLEMTGLDVREDTILEIAVIITDSNLHIIAEGPVIAIHHDHQVIKNMNDWCQKVHYENGLVKRVEKSNYSMEQAEQEVLSFIKKYVQRGMSPLCGNSIYQDRKFLAKYMPILEEYFHYRLLDVSTLKILVNRWYPEVSRTYTKESKHLALDDIKDSINELNHYRNTVMK